MPVIRLFETQDWSTLGPLLRATFEAGDTYAFSPDSTESQIHQAWIEAPQSTYVATTESGEVVATYILKPNQPGLGDHVCNCGYVVAASSRGQGLAAQLCKHSQNEAQRLGYRAMQFNLVVSTNAVAVRLWKALGFTVVGTLPGAFRHATLGFVDAYIMFKTLVAA